MPGQKKRAPQSGGKPGAGQRGGRQRKNNGRGNTARPPQRRPRRKPAPKVSLFRRILIALGLAEAARPTRRISNTALAAEAEKKRHAKAAPVPNGAAKHPVTSPRVYVGNLSYDVTEEDLTELFGGAGHVAHTEIIADPETQRSEGHAFVDMYTRSEAERAIATLHDRAFLGRRLLVTGAPPEAPAPDEPADTVPEKKPGKDIVLVGKRGG